MHEMKASRNLSETRARCRVLLASVAMLSGVLVAGGGVGASPTRTSPLTAVFDPVHAVSKSVVAETASVLGKRLSMMGASQSSATAEGSQIVVVLRSVADPVDTLAVLGAPARLYFRPALCNAPVYAPPAKVISGSPEANGGIPTCGAPYRYSSTDLNAASSAYSYPGVDRVYATYPTTSPLADDPTRNVLLTTNGTGPNPREVFGPATVVSNGSSEVLSSADIAKASAVDDRSNGQWQVVFAFSPTGASLFNADAARYYRLPLSDDLDGRIVAQPIIEATSFPDSVQVSGNFSKTSATALAAELGAGPLPVDLTLKHSS
jgi:preprotein translocase subunit SecD